MAQVWYAADQKGSGYTTNPLYAKKDKKGKPIIPVELYRAKQK